MPYIIKLNKSKNSKWKKWLIYNTELKQIVASSNSKAKAKRSIGYREAGAKEKSKIIKVL